MLAPCPQDIVGVKTCRSIVVLDGEVVFCILVRPPLPERTDWPLGGL